MAKKNSEKEDYTATENEEVNDKNTEVNAEDNGGSSVADETPERDIPPESGGNETVPVGGVEKDPSMKQNAGNAEASDLSKEIPAPTDEVVTETDDKELGNGAGDADVPPVVAETDESGGKADVLEPAEVEAEGNGLPDLNLTNEELGEQFLSQARTRVVMNAERKPLNPTEAAETGEEDDTELTPLQKAQSEYDALSAQYDALSDEERNGDAGSALRKRMREAGYSLDAERIKEQTEKAKTEAQTALDKYNALAEEYNALSPEEKNGEKGKALEKQMADALGDLTDAQAAVEAAQREEYVSASPEVAAYQQSLDDMTERYNSLQQALEEIIGTKTKEDDEKTERDKWRTFWSGIGEIGSSLVNQMGVSGVFGGRNAYGRGAYSSMMKFNLTTKEFSDQAEAAHEKRQKAIDDLEKQRLSLQEKIDLYLTQGAATLGQLKATRGDAYDKAKADAAAALAKARENEANRKNAKEIAEIRAAGRGRNGSNGSSGSGDTTTKGGINHIFTNKWGDSVMVSGNQTTIDNAVIQNAPNFANDIATQLGYTTYQHFIEGLEDINQRVCENHNSNRTEKEIKRGRNEWNPSTHKLTVDEIAECLAVAQGDNAQYTESEIRSFVTALLNFRAIGESQETKSEDEWQENLRPDYKGSTESWAKTYGPWAKNYGTIMGTAIQSAQAGSETQYVPTSGAATTFTIGGVTFTIQQ